MSVVQLRDYQQEALDAIVGAMHTRRQLLALPTGTGKTIIFSELIRRRGGRALVLVHRDELVQQAVEKFALYAHYIPSVGVVKAERNELNALAVVASVQTLSRPARLAQVPRDHFRTIVVDEAHHATERTYRTVLDHVRAGEEADNGPLLLGVTATPFRGDGKDLAEIFGQIVYQRTLLDMIQRGHLADLIPWSVKLEADFNQLRTVRGFGGERDYVDRELEHVLRAANAPTHVVRAYQEHAAGRRALVFTPTVDIAYEMAKAFVTAGVPAEALDGKTPTNERRSSLARLRSGETKVIANCALFNEGFDEPRLDCIIIARPTRSKLFFTQMIGRGTRIFPGKENCLVIDVVGATERHDLVTVGSLFGMSIRHGESVLEAEVRTRAEAEAAQLAEAEAARLVAERVDLFRQRKLHWAVAPEGDLFVMNLGRQLGSLRLLKQGGQWDVVHVGSKDDNYRRTILASRVPLDLATGVAEDFARSKSKATSLLDPEAAWANRAPSPATIRAAAKWRLDVGPSETQRQLGDRIALKIARWAERQARGRKGLHSWRGGR